MPLDRLRELLAKDIDALEQQGLLKSRESVIAAVIPPAAGLGPRYLLQGEGERPFLRMNSNGYLGMSLRAEVLAAEEEAVRVFGAGPGAVRFIGGTYAPHVALEQRLAQFHDREAVMLFSSAYAAVMGTLPALISAETVIFSDALNHSCIINAMRLAQPREKHIYRHLDMQDLEDGLRRAARRCRRAIIVTDGIFSMRGDHAPLDRIVELARRYDPLFAENVVVMVDDSHGVGAFGATGRGTEEYTGSGKVDVLVATLGKALGVNGGYVAASRVVVDYLREKAPFYIYSNPITPGEAAAAAKALELLDSPVGERLLERLRRLTRRFEQGVITLGLETIAGEHPVVPVMIRDTPRTLGLIRHLQARAILATGLAYPVVPRGDEEVRFQISADHTETDIDEVLTALSDWSALR